MSSQMVVFRNKGAIDPKSITTFGVSSKENEGAIGFFGTGLKYAIAILLREGCSITIYSGTKKLEFGTRREKIRVDEFTMVTMNRRSLGFTTEVGKTWEIWQAFREIYCNTLDEKGEFFTCSEEPDAVEGETMIVVRGQPFLATWEKRLEIVLGGVPEFTLGAVNVHSGESDYIYYRGIRALKLDRPSMYTYNIQTNLDLTEDRTIKHGFYASHYVAQALARMENKYAVQRVLTCDEAFYESGLSFEGADPSDEFKTVVRLLTKQFDAKLNKSAIKACQGDILSSLGEMHSIQLNEIDQARMAKAITFCKRIGYPVDEYPIIVSEFLGEGVLGRAHDEKIFIGQRVLMMGTKMLAGTLIEEFIHLRHKLRDETYMMQNFLFDALVSMGERIVGEAL